MFLQILMNWVSFLLQALNPFLFLVDQLSLKWSILYIAWKNWFQKWLSKLLHCYLQCQFFPKLQVWLLPPKPQWINFWFWGVVGWKTIDSVPSIGMVLVQKIIDFLSFSGFLMKGKCLQMFFLTNLEIQTPFSSIFLASLSHQDASRFLFNWRRLFVFLKKTWYLFLTLELEYW